VSRPAPSAGSGGRQPTRGKRRRRGVPAPPLWERPVTAALDGRTDVLSLLVWQMCRDVRLWALTGPDERSGLFDTGAASVLAQWASREDCGEAPAEPLRALLGVVSSPAGARVAEVARACEALREWAVSVGRPEAALQFAEAAAFAQPESSARAREAAKISRDLADHGRAALWFRRAAALAWQAGSDTELARARLGLGVLAHNLGKLAEAAEHCGKARRAALRNGNVSLAAQAHHELFLLHITARNHGQALTDATEAARLYPTKDARLPAFAFDLGFFWTVSGYYSSAATLFTKVGHYFTAPEPRTLYLAVYARAAAAVRDRLRFERLKAEACALAVPGTESEAVAMFHLAEGARAFERWTDAHELACAAQNLARARANEPLAERAAELLAAVDLRSLGAEDVVPLAGSAPDLLTSTVITKLQGLASG
jgi:tetratricopeptide (TPR) repeat protein